MLRVIFGSWIDHSKNHSEKFRKWEQKAKDTGCVADYSQILQAVRQMEEANEQLSAALKELKDK